MESVRKIKDTKEVRKVLVSFVFIYLLFMTSRAIFNPYVTVYLQEKGFAAEKIGLVTGANSFMLIIAQPLWGIVTDRLRSSKYTLVICMMVQAIFSVALLYSNTFFAIAACFCLYGFFSSPEGPLLDTWCLKSLKKVGYHNSVGQMKFAGCFGYALSSILSGYIISSYDTTKILPVYSCILFLIAGFLLLVRVDSRERKKEKEALSKLNPGKIIKDKRFLFFLLIIFIMQIPHRAAYTFYPLLISELGGAKTFVGYTSAIMFLSEGIVLFFSKKLLSRYHPGKIIMFSGAFFLIWQLLYAVVGKPWQVAAIAVLDGPSYALFTIGILYFLDETAPSDMRTTYQTITYAVYFGLSGIAGNSVGGWMLGNFGFQKLYLVGAAVIGAAMCGLHFMNKMKR